MANMKRLEKRLENVEKWLKEFEKGTGPAQTMDNMNFLAIYHWLRSNVMKCPYCRQ